MGDEIIIRPAVVCDAVEIEIVARRTWNTAYTGIILPEIQERYLRQNYSTEALKKAISQEHSWFFVAATQEEVIGYAQFSMRERDDRSAELSRIYVLPGWQRKGTGVLLLSKGLTALAQAGIARLFVVVERDNPIGRRFYEKHGFHPIRELSVELFGQILPLVEYRLDETSAPPRTLHSLQRACLGL